MALKITRMRNGGQVVLQLDKLTMLQQAIKSRFVTQVGVLGSKTSRTEAKDQTNADIGLLHEKGSLSRGIPRRSFLLMPLQQKSEMLMAVKDQLWDKFLNGKQTVASLKAAYRDMGLQAEIIIQKAFETAGFGHWAPDSARTIARKHSSKPLIDTGQLRASISSRVASK